MWEFLHFIVTITLQAFFFWLSGELRIAELLLGRNYYTFIDTLFPSLNILEDSVEPRWCRSGEGRR